MQYLHVHFAQRNRREMVLTRILDCSLASVIPGDVFSAFFVPIVTPPLTADFYNLNRGPPSSHWIYLEANMTNTLKAWLKVIPGVTVNYTSDSIILEVVAHSDWTACLNVVSQERSPLDHSWMRVSRGQWSGKMALMIEETVDGCDCLLIPTLSVLPHSYIDGTAHISARPVLFDGQEMLKAHGSRMVTSKGPYRFRFQKNIYEHGLLRVFLPRRRLSETEEIDDTDLELFAASTHPEMLHGLASIPLPKSWRFFAREKVDVSAVLFDVATVVLSSGTITEVCSDGLFICDDSDGTSRWIDSCLTVTKHFETGDYVNLSHDSWGGFVEAVQGRHLCLLSVKRSPGLTCTFEVEVCSPFLSRGS